MAAEFTQDGRPMSVKSPLGKDVLLLTGLRFRESMSSPFAGELEMLSKEHSIDPMKIVGKGVTVTVLDDDATSRKRYFHGIVRTFESGALENRGLRRYRAEIVPTLALLGLRSDCKVFQDKSVKDIVTAVLQECGLTDFEWNLNATHDVRTYCVQYREACLDFVQRLLEEEGIYYFFRHQDGKHVLVFADAASAYGTCAQAGARFTDGALDEPHIASWLHRYEIRPGKSTLRDFNFETPATIPQGTTNTVVQLPGTSGWEIYDYPGGFLKAAEGATVAKRRMEELEAPWSVVTGGGTCATFTPGSKFELLLFDPDKSQEKKKFTLVSVVHEARDESYATGGKQGRYFNSFECIPDSVVFRPVRSTRRPVVEGPQTAVVVGPSGEEIYVDKYGRIKVQFHWDRLGQKKETSSCWVRVAQGWAGATWGSYQWPRIGQEVVVDFLEGDPDRPIVTGGVYNADQMPPYALPDNKTRSGWKSRSSKGAGAENFNEIRFEDKKGSEEVYVHAEKDFLRVVENNDVLKVGFEKKDKGDQTIEVHNDRTITVKEGKQTTTVEKGDDLLEVRQGKHSVIVGQGDDLHQVKTGKRDVLVDTGNDTHKVATGNRTVEVGMGNDSLTVKMGNQTTKISLGKSTTEAMQSIELKVGGSSIKVDQTGVTIKGPMITIEASAMLSAKGLMSEVKGTAMLTLNGAITMIN
ncbi:MAG: type VI secretion system tip protein VgrG [Planctomycetes bacterium]|nr:type VI secretion system tip protein VgrG [Planctomycetota bacterium]